MVEKRRLRDGEEFHVTLLNAREYGSRRKAGLLSGIPEEMALTFFGIGRAESKKDEAVFAIAASGYADSLRMKMNLPPKDLHMTLGFSMKDVYGVGKGMDTEVVSFAAVAKFIGQERDVVLSRVQRFSR